MIPIISIVIPVYNAELTLGRCLNSIASQTFSDFEVILINDGSKDNSGEICQLYVQLDSRFSYYEQINSGVSAARNAGLEIAKGQFLVFIDSDDYVAPDFLKSYIDILNIYPNALVYQGFVSEYANKQEILSLEKGVYCDEQICEALFEVEFKQCLGGAWTKIFITEIINKNNIRFNPYFDYGEDKIFTLEYINNINCVILLEDAKYHYDRTQENSLSKKHHRVEKLKMFIEREYSLFTDVLKKYPSDKLRKAVNGRYISFNKYILLSMYRKVEKSKRKERKRAALEIKKFAINNDSDSRFEREVPKIVSKLYDNDLIMMMMVKIKNLLR